MNDLNDDRVEWVDLKAFVNNKVIPVQYDKFSDGTQGYGMPLDTTLEDILAIKELIYKIEAYYRVVRLGEE